MPELKDPDYPSEEIGEIARGLALCAVVLLLVVLWWADGPLARWIGGDLARAALCLLGFGVLLLGTPITDAIEARLANWYCTRHGGHVFRPFGDSDHLTICIRCNHVRERRKRLGNL